MEEACVALAIAREAIEDAVPIAVVAQRLRLALAFRLIFIIAGECDLTGP